MANRLGLTLNVGEEGRVVVSLQPLFDEGPEDDLEAHRELVLVGLMSGWLAGIAMKGGGFGRLGDIILGLSGSFVGSWIFQARGAPEAGWGGIGIAAFVAAALMITLQRKIWPAQVAYA